MVVNLESDTLCVRHVGVDETDKVHCCSLRLNTGLRCAGILILFNRISVLYARKTYGILEEMLKYFTFTSKYSFFNLICTVTCFNITFLR